MLKIVVAATATEKEQVVLIHKAKFMENGGEPFVRVDFTLNPDRGCERLVAIVTRSEGKVSDDAHVSEKIEGLLFQKVFVIDPLRANRQKRTPKFAEAVLLGAALTLNEGGWIVPERLGSSVLITESEGSTVADWVDLFEGDYVMRAADGALDDDSDEDDEDEESN